MPRRSFSIAAFAMEGESDGRHPLRNYYRMSGAGKSQAFTAEDLGILH